MDSYMEIALISIHAPAKGATVFQRFDLKCSTSFQSTLPRRERHITQVGMMDL